MTDEGKHYRFNHVVKVGYKDLLRGYVEIKLDPFRIASIYGMKSFAMMTILKKCLVAGGRGHKCYKQDIRDIINAAKRELEILEENEKIIS